VFLGQRYRSNSKVQSVPRSEVPSYKQSTGCSLVRGTDCKQSTVFSLEVPIYKKKYLVFLGQKYRATSILQGVLWSEVLTELQAEYRMFLGQKYRYVSKVQDAVPPGATSGVHEIDKCLKAELQAILMSVYRVSEWPSWKAFRALKVICIRCLRLIMT
jgi:hypothetical protein